MDAADITGNNDFTEEKLKLHLNTMQKVVPIQRGRCLFCKEELAPLSGKSVNAEPIYSLYCDPDESDCREEHERRELLKRKTGRMLSGSPY